ncbi:MAG: BON domain-containing protein [Pseudomonadota bacterium]
MNRSIVVVFFLMMSINLGGCAGAIVAGAAVGASTAHDRRTTGTIVEDEAIEIKVASLLRENEDFRKKSSVSAVSFNNIVLLVGQAASTEISRQIAKEVANIPKVRRVHNEIRKAAPSSTLTESSDVWITSKVKTMMIAEKDLDSTRVKIYTENGEVFLMGLVTQLEARRAIAVARNISGVQKIVELFEYISPQG